MKRRRTLIIALSMLIALAAALWLLTRLPPAWWSPPAAGDAEAARLADRVEYGIVEQAHKIREDDKPWSVRLTEAQINAWLALRLRPWVERDASMEWPAEVELVQVRLQPGTLTFAAAVRGDGGRRFVSIAALPVVQAGTLTLEFAGSALGRLPVPRSLCALLLNRAAQPQATGSADDGSGRDVQGLLDGGVTMPALVTLNDDRRVELVQVVAGDGELIVTCRTRPRSTE